MVVIAFWFGDTVRWIISLHPPVSVEAAIAAVPTTTPPDSATTACHAIMNVVGVALTSIAYSVPKIEISSGPIDITRPLAVTVGKLGLHEGISVVLGNDKLFEFAVIFLRQ